MATADPRRVFAQAEAFAAAADTLRPAPGAPPEALAPYIACSVFACELYLKCLLLLAKGKFPQIHNLQALFADLPAPEAGRVRRLHQRMYHSHFPAADASDPSAADARFDAILAGSRDAFHLARYLYEAHARQRDGIPDVTPVLTAVRGRILTLEPGFAARG